MKLLEFDDATREEMRVGDVGFNYVLFNFIIIIINNIVFLGIL